MDTFPMTENALAPLCIAVDWGTSRFRAYLVAHDHSVLDRIASDDGMSTVDDGDFAALLKRHCGAWIAVTPGIPVVMAGMVGSRNGWREVPYVPCPAGLGEIAAGIQRFDAGDGLMVAIVPGLTVNDGTTFDVMRGEETQILGTGTDDAVVILPGTHSKWATVEGGRIVSFRTFMTGEVYGLLRTQSILRLLSDDEGADQATTFDDAAFAGGLVASRRAGGILHQAFSARTGVLAGDMSGSDVGPFLSGLLIGTEIREGSAFSPTGRTHILIADGVVARGYRLALEEAGFATVTIDPQQAFVDGVLRLVRDR
jgi:2-dehydro-3-deoxygalactonokinase